MKVVLITGVLGGMGRATAKLLLDSGYTVIGLDLAEFCDLPIDYYKTNLTDAESIEKTFNLISNCYKQIDTIINFAGIYRMGSLVEMTEKEFTSIFDINLFSIYRVNKTFLPLLKQGGNIIITSSELAPLDPLPFTGIYAITKSTVEKYAYSLKMELQLLGINVSVIRPGAVKTKLLNDSINSMEELHKKTVLYKTNVKNFSNIVNSVEAKNIEPEKISKLVKKILNKKNPKFVYNINRNILLRILSFLPKFVQLKIIRRILQKGKI